MDNQKQTSIKQKVMDMSKLCKGKAVGKALLPTQPKMEDNFGIISFSAFMSSVPDMGRC